MRLSRSEQTADTLVSIVVSTHAGERLLAGCLEMLLAQTIAPRTEIIVIDSGSPENERSIAENFQGAHANVRYLRTERETIFAAWNRGLSMSSGTYFVNVNVDDWIRHDALERFALALDQHPDASLAYAHWATTRRAQQPPGPDDVVNFHPAYEPALPLFYTYSGCTQFWRRSSLVELGGFDPSLLACGDLDVLIRLAERGGTAVLVPEVLAGYFHNPEGISLSTDNSILEQVELFTAARANMPLDRLYAIDPGDSLAVGDAWVTLGNFAFDVGVPWHDGPLRDTDFALECYDRALAMSPDHADALHNRYILLVIVGRHAEAVLILDRLPAAEAAVLRGVDLALRRPAIQPAVRGPVFT